MFVECLDETRIQHNGKELLFERVQEFGYIYLVEDGDPDGKGGFKRSEFGTKVMATGKFRVIPELPKGKIAELPISHPIGQ